MALLTIDSFVKLIWPFLRKLNMNNKLCLAPFCPNPKYFNKNKTYGYCTPHIRERSRYKIKSYKELLPLWAFTRCKIHGLLNYDQTYNHKCKGKIIRFLCKLCKKSYINSRYDPVHQKSINDIKYQKKRDRELRCVYKISRSELNEMIEKQNNLCKICLLPPLKILHIDHCHKTGLISGLLCHKCNAGLGMFKDSINNLNRAIEYLS
jgi:hypothetical protein